MGKAKTHSGNVSDRAKSQDDVVTELVNPTGSVYPLDPGPLPRGKIRGIRLFFAITSVTNMTPAGDSLLKTGAKSALV
jgi:hypothetical protein